MEIIIRPAKTTWDAWAGPMGIVLYILGISFFIVLWYTDPPDFLITLVFLLFIAMLCRLLAGSIATYVWISWGFEKIQRQNAFLIIRRELFGKAITNSYEITRIQNLRLTPRDEQYSYSTSKDTSRIAFDYNQKKVRFCRSVPNEQAEGIIQKVSQLADVPISRWAG
jgi:hypothetical protein